MSKDELFENTGKQPKNPPTKSGSKAANPEATKEAPKQTQKPRAKKDVKEIELPLTSKEAAEDYLAALYPEYKGRALVSASGEVFIESPSRINYAVNACKRRAVKFWEFHV